MITEIHDQHPNAQTTTWRIQLNNSTSEPRVEFFEIHDDEPEYSCFVASYHLSSLICSQTHNPVYLDAAHPEVSLSVSGMGKLQRWLQETAC